MHHWERRFIAQLCLLIFKALYRKWSSVSPSSCTSSATFIYLFQHLLAQVWSVGSSRAVSVIQCGLKTSNTQHRIKIEALFFWFAVKVAIWWRLLLTAAITWQSKWALFSCLPRSVHAWTWMRIQIQYQRCIFTLTNHTAENKTTQSMFAFSIMSLMYTDRLFLFALTFTWRLPETEWRRHKAWLRRKHTININK